MKRLKISEDGFEYLKQTLMVEGLLDDTGCINDNIVIKRKGSNRRYILCNIYLNKLMSASRKLGQLARKFVSVGYAISGKKFLNVKEGDTVIKFDMLDEIGLPQKYLDEAGDVPKNINERGELCTYINSEVRQIKIIDDPEVDDSASILYNIHKEKEEDNKMETHVGFSRNGLYHCEQDGKQTEQVVNASEVQNVINEGYAKVLQDLKHHNDSNETLLDEDNITKSL